MDVNYNNDKPVEDEQPSARSLDVRKRGAEGPVESVECPAKRAAMSDKSESSKPSDDSENDDPRYAAGASGVSKKGLGPVAAMKRTVTPPRYSPMDDSARRAWVDRKCARYESEPAGTKEAGRKLFGQRLAQFERWLSEIRANTDVGGKASVDCDFCEEIDGEEIARNASVKELVLRSSQTGLYMKYLHGLRKLFPKMQTLTIEIKDVWFSCQSDRKERWIFDINEISGLLESFLHTDDVMEHTRLVVLDKPGVAVRSFKGFHRDADKFVKEVRNGAKTFSASVQASSENIFGRRFY